MTNMHNTKALQLQLKLIKCAPYIILRTMKIFYAAQKKLFDNISVLTEKLYIDCTSPCTSPLGGKNIINIVPLVYRCNR